MEQFYITLPSNSSESFYPENTISEFRTKLPQALEFQDKWEVGLCELIFPANWYNVVKGGNNVTFRRQPGKITTPRDIQSITVQGVFPDINSLVAELRNQVKRVVQGSHGAFFYENRNVKIDLPERVSKIALSRQLAHDLGMEKQEITDKVTLNTKQHVNGAPHRLYSFTIQIEGKEESMENGVNVTYPIPEGHYERPDMLLHTLNSLMVATLSIPRLQRREGFYKAGKYIEVKLPYDGIEIELDWPLGALLGFKERVIKGRDRITGEYPFDVKNSFYSLFIYSDIIEPQVVGDTHAKLLQVTPAPQRTNTIISHTFNPVQYVPLEKKHFESILIAIRNSAGDLVPFTTGLSIVKLHFRPRI